MVTVRHDVILADAAAFAPERFARGRFALLSLTLKWKKLSPVERGWRCAMRLIGAVVLRVTKGGDRSMTTISVVFGLIFIVIGILYAVAPGAMWSVQKFSNSMDGEKSERTGAWEFTRVLRAMFYIIGGIIFMIWGSSQG